MCLAWHEIRDHLTASASTFSFQRSFDAVRRAQAALAPFRDPAALLDGLHRTPGDQGQKNLILAALVRAAQGDGPASDCALTLLLLALWPGLDAIRRRSLWRRLGTADEVASDVLARTMAAAMTKHLGQSVVVENTVGAGGTIGANRVAKASPDGYTVFIHHNGMATSVGLYRKLSFNPMEDFEYVGLVADVPIT